MNEHRSWDSHREEFASRWLNGQTPVSDDFEVLASAHIDEVRAVVVADYAVAVIFSSWLENGVWVLASMAGFVSLVDIEILTRGSFSIGNTNVWYAKIFGRLPDLEPTALLIHGQNADPLTRDEHGIFLHLRRMSARDDKPLQIAIPDAHGQLHIFRG
jgi:hypothetical protein